MSDHYVKVKVQLEQMKSCGEDAEKQGVDTEEQLPVSSSPASVSPDPSSITVARGDASNTSITCKHRGKSRSKQGKDDKNSCGKHISDLSLHGSVVSAHVGKNLNGLGLERTLHIKGTGKILQGKSEPNGNYLTIHASKNIQDTRREDGFKLARKRRPVTVDTSKAKTSLEALKLSIKQLKWKEFPLGRRTVCDIYWHGVSFHDNENIVSGQVNKFPGMIEMLRKINLSRAVRTMQELFPEEYNFYPRSWILPEEYQQFSTQIRMVKENDATVNPTFIVKPDGGSQGDGIYLIRDPSDLKLMTGSQAKQAVVQEYIQKPLLIDKLKFDIRLYVLIKSLEPLEIYIAKEGLTRFCTEPYQEPSQKNLTHVFMHLTNYSLNVHSGNFVHSDSQSTGSKRTLSSVLYRLAAKGVDIKKILGFDILLMKNLKPVLLEVNSNPSMRIEHEKEVSPGVFEYVPSPVDEEVKVGVIRDTLRLMDPGHKKPSISQSRAGGSEHREEIPMEGETQERSSDEGALPSLCLKQVYPKYTKQFNHLRLVERIAVLFIRFLGVKGNMRLGPTAFRTFIRTCKLSNSNFTMASVDILYIDITRRWSGTMPDSREAGMGVQAFVEAFFFLAGRRFKSLVLREQVVSLLELCEAQLESQSGPEDRRSVSCSRALPRAVKTQTLGLTNPQLGSPAPLRRAASQDYRLHQRLKPRTLRANVDN
ncbi:tubulin polyglutamylase TTLL11 isoform X2 [Seriola lalandi dorsalis]|uniref:tubulin polyglutamylase TTLL11 isoform X2 n=1 Tax=Seriola lalandi dorsalis TaxID=1841481 RepID=UPI000C6F473E|nr:tubulin polyglutamylase TTLL11 isoform X2 [Seriola lalandi dorsalis]XP_056259690.1 tubulin polyglutamylase TTLL11 isoform X2 [Seriola aureovittata]